MNWFIVLLVTTDKPFGAHALSIDHTQNPPHFEAPKRLPSQAFRRTCQVPLEAESPPDIDYRAERFSCRSVAQNLRPLSLGKQFHKGYTKKEKSK